MVGDPATEPTDSVDSLDGLVDMQDNETEDELDALDIDGGEADDEGEQEDGPDTDEDEDSDPEPKATVKLKHDGKEVEVPEAELIPLAQQGLDYSKKTMALAEDRKAVDTERAQLREVRQQQDEALEHTLHRLQAFAAFAESQVGDEPDVSLLHRDTATYILAQKQHEARKGQLQQAMSAIGQVQEEQARQRHAWLIEQADATEAELRNTLPGWNDESMQSLAGYARGLGLTPDQHAEAFVTKGLWEALHKAKAYDELVAKKAQLKPKAELPRVEKPKASATPNRTQQRQAQAMERYKRAPSVQALADLMD